MKIGGSARSGPAAGATYATCSRVAVAGTVRPAPAASPLVQGPAQITAACAENASPPARTVTRRPSGCTAVTGRPQRTSGSVAASAARTRPAGITQDTVSLTHRPPAGTDGDGG